MRQELVAETDAFAGALDQPGDVGHGQLAAVGRIDRPEHRCERRKRILGHLRAGVRDPRQQRRLARVRQPDQPHVREQPQPQLDPALLPRQPALGETRSLAGGVREPAVAAPAGAAARDDGMLAGAQELITDLVGRIDDRRPRRHGDLQRFAGGAVARATLAVAPAASLEVRPAVKGAQVSQRVVAA
jgi:hypothetical protein